MEQFDALQSKAEEICHLPGILPANVFIEPNPELKIGLKEI
jgi:hypothetical protein